MEIGIILHEADPFTLNGMGNNNSRLPLDQLRLLKGVKKLVKVVPVNLNNVPAKGSPALCRFG